MAEFHIAVTKYA